MTAATDLEGIVLRYGLFYGPGTAIASDGSVGVDVRRRRVPVVGDGEGVWSFVHIDDVAAATVAALERGRPGIYNIVDDEPGKVSEWLPALAEALGAGPPRRVPAWVGRLAVGSHGVAMMTEIRGASNAKARRELELGAPPPELARGVPHGARLSRPCEDSGPMDGGDGPRFGAMIGLVAVVVATVILVFFGIGYALGRLFL